MHHLIQFKGKVYLQCQSVNIVKIISAENGVHFIFFFEFMGYKTAFQIGLLCFIVLNKSCINLCFCIVDVWQTFNPETLYVSPFKCIFKCNAVTHKHGIT